MVTIRDMYKKTVKVCYKFVAGIDLLVFERYKDRGGAWDGEMGIFRALPDEVGGGPLVITLSIHLSVCPSVCPS